MGETNFNIIQNTDYLKKLTGQDLVRAEFKGKDCFDFRNYAKLIMATNSIPPTADKTIGFYRRWKIIDFPNKFAVEKDILKDISPREYENLALKCLNIAKKLWIDRVFTNEGDFEERERVYEERANPLMLYIKENYEEDINKETLFSEFFRDLNKYLKSKGHRILTAIAVSRQLKNEGLDVKTFTKDGKNGKFILGIIKKNYPNEPNEPYLQSDSHKGLTADKVHMGNMGNKAEHSPQKSLKFSEAEIEKSAPEVQEYLENEEKAKFKKEMGGFGF